MFLWGVGGVLALLTQAVLRLLPVALEPLAPGELSPAGLVAYGAWVVFMAWSEGYRGFQHGFSPRVVRRALELPARSRPALWLLAPLVAMGLLHATPKRLTISWTVVALVAAAVMAVRSLPSPWRGLIDGGVVVGLGWGIAATVGFAAAALAGRAPTCPTDFPEEPSDEAALPVVTPRAASAPAPPRTP